MPKKPFTHTPIKLEALPNSIYYQLRSLPEHTIYPAHEHPWGEFVFSFSGVLEMQAEGKEFRIPPSFGLWHPPGSEHHGGNRHASIHCSLYIDQALATERGMPDKTCALLVNPMLKAILNHLRLNPPQIPYTKEENKLLDVVLDQLVVTPIAGSYLPDSKDPLLAKVLAYLKENPGSNRPLSELAELFGASERTLARKAQKDLGIAISEWRQRMKVMHSLPMLQEGHSVESIALELGYSSASAFIAMFRRLLDTTPDEYRKSQS
ncbi:AraC family transcriptional regulator [Aliamphritea hakodatensis]|uniref:AraC family transcriptional regulator n=1 Tax=Aliamphritea hakodatensis TaxID=2895352 RepID=UPI0022FD6C08|nr:helix-turn-helix transcriptional regulator [Aliamphritea hakodatensis]